MPQGKKLRSEKDLMIVSQWDESASITDVAKNTFPNHNNSSNNSGKSRKRKHSDLVRFSDLESEFDDCDLEDAAALETKLRKVARRNSLTHEEMMKLLHKFVKNEHILALVTLKAENELAKEKQANEEQRAIIITETPSVPKLTRAKARELKTPIRRLTSLKDQEPEPEIAALIKDDLHSDEDDEEYIFKDEDFVSDDDPNTNASDLESNPRTPQTPTSHIGDSPIKLSDDGCFKVPFSKKCEYLSEELRIATRTRSKLCLQQTTIEDLQSDFVPPDVEEPLERPDLHDEVWMQFLNDFTKPLNTSLVADDDDPINDPEYVAAEKVRVDAEELRDVNISKKELSELVAELYDDLMAEGLSMESIDLETPDKWLLTFQDDTLHTPHTSPERLKSNLDVTKKLEFVNDQEFCQSMPETQTESTNIIYPQQTPEIPREYHQITSTNSQNDYIFHPGIISSPFSHNKLNNYNEYNALNSDNMTLIPIAQKINNGENNHDKTISIGTSTLNDELELIAAPVSYQPNCSELAKVVDYAQNFKNSIDLCQTTTKSTKVSPGNTTYERNKNNYLSIRRRVTAEYIDQFKTLQNAQDTKISSTTTEYTDSIQQNINVGFTQYQYNLMQQQLRIHVQQVTQTYVQTYCHPELWKLAPKCKELLLDLQEKAKDNLNLKVWNLELAMELIHNWQNELDPNTTENTELMNFIHRENSIANLGRRFPRFHPRILDCYLNSAVFMYPQYLPRMPFSTKPSIPVFSPVESYLIAMGLEKHLKIIYERKEKIYKSTPLREACRRLAKDTVYGKSYRRIWDHILHLQRVDYYNPIKYFFEHNRAPPVDHDPIWTFNNNVVLPPKDRISELPLVFQTYLQRKNEPPKPKPVKKVRKRSSVKVSDSITNSLEFVQQLVGQNLLKSNLYSYPVESSETPFTDSDSNLGFEEIQTQPPNPMLTARKKLPQSLIVNINYVYGNALDTTTSTNTSLSALQTQRNLFRNTETTINNISANNNKLLDSNVNTAVDLTQNNFTKLTTNTNCPVITYNFDWETKSFQTAADVSQSTFSHPTSSHLLIRSNATTHPICTNINTKLGAINKVCGTFKLNKKIKQRASAYREKRNLKRRCEELITTYSLYLEKLLCKYKEFPLLHHYYRYFKALELYTYFLKDLKTNCNRIFNKMSNSSNNSPSTLKRTRNNNTDDDNSPSSARQTKKLHRQEENFRHMLLPDTPEETNRKDAIYAFNFYEKVEETFKIAKKPEDCKKFNTILKSFNPRKDKVTDLYYNLEKLFLPDHPELAQVFLTFLLPSEAAEIGRFFDNFMINNMSTFINKLNIYFNKQPAQIRKVYNCLNDLAEDPNITMKKVETKIVPLLKGNQFLIDWFMQQFPQNIPPIRLFSNPENINLKDHQCNRSGEYVETLIDLMDSPTNDGQQQQSCQLKYINGSIFYGSKMLLPAKLSFMAASYNNKTQNNELPRCTPCITCVHGIREHGENRLQAAADLTSTHINAIEPPSGDDQDKSEEEDTSKSLVIDTTADEEDSCSSLELCDETSLRAHATRLNPSVYSSTCCSSNATGITNTMNNFQGHHANAKRTILNFNEEAKLSPRKSSVAYSTHAHLNLPSSIAAPISCSHINPKEKRKSPSKKTKSPLNNNSKMLRTNQTAQQPMVVIHQTSSAIQCAKRLKSLIEGDGQSEIECAEELIDSKEILKIVAKTKNSLLAEKDLAAAQTCQDVKEEKPEVEFLVENSALSPSPFPCLRIETDSNEEDVYNVKTPPTQSSVPSSDDDCKIDIVTSLTTDTEENTSAVASNVTSQIVLPLNAAWKRDEDKNILIEMKIGSQNREELLQRIAQKLPNRTMFEIISRHQFLMEFLSKLQGK